jgi:hypothetical protein
MKHLETRIQTFENTFNHKNALFPTLAGISAKANAFG